jgi:hypothetical protein
MTTPQGDADHDVRTGALDAGVEARDPEGSAGTTGGGAGDEAPGFGGGTTMGTGPGGTAMGNAGTRSAAGTAANTELSDRDDLTTTSGSERSSTDDATGDSMIDMARDRDSDQADTGER